MGRKPTTRYKYLPCRMLYTDCLRSLMIGRRKDSTHSIPSWNWANKLVSRKNSAAALAPRGVTSIFQ